MVKLFRALIILSLLSVILGAVAATIFEQNHPEVENFLSHMDNKDIFFKMPDVVAMIIGLSFLVAYFVINIALFLFKSWARDANLILNLLACLTTPFWGFMFLSPLDSLFYDLATFVGGVILALTYFSSLKDKFKDSAISRALNQLQ